MKIITIDMLWNGPFPPEMIARFEQAFPNGIPATPASLHKAIDEFWLVRRFLSAESRERLDTAIGLPNEARGRELVLAEKERDAELDSISDATRAALDLIRKEWDAEIDAVHKKWRPKMDSIYEERDAKEELVKAKYSPILIALHDKWDADIECLLMGEWQPQGADES